MKPSFQKLWQEFPTHTQYPNMKALYEALGGQAERNIYVDGFGPDGNACASRLSVAFNKAGTPISAAITEAIGVRTLKTKDGSHIIYSVAEFRKYLAKVIGSPVVDKVNAANPNIHTSLGEFWELEP